MSRTRSPYKSPRKRQDLFDRLLLAICGLLYAISTGSLYAIGGLAYRAGGELSSMFIFSLSGFCALCAVRLLFKAVFNRF